jgi:hypothetical protein
MITLLDEPTLNALEILADAEAQLALHSGGKCPCGEERDGLKNHYPYRHVLNAARCLARTVEVTRGNGTFPPDAVYQVYGTPVTPGRITAVCIGGAETEAEAFEKAASWIRDCQPRGGAYVFELRGYAYPAHPFQHIYDAAEARRLIGCE